MSIPTYNQLNNDYPDFMKNNLNVSFVSVHNFFHHKGFILVDDHESNISLQNSWQSIKKVGLKYKHEGIDELRKTSVRLDHRRGKFRFYLEAKGRTVNKTFDLEISPVQNNDDADRIIGRVFRTLEVQIAELMVKVKQKRSNIAMDNRDVAAPALSPSGVEINLIPPEEQDKMESKQMTTAVPEKAKEEQSE